MTVHPDDRPDPLEQPIRARVPDRVAGGCFSTGVIVMTAQTEFVLDFVQNLGRPHQIVARVVMPHSVLPQLVDALGRNMQLYRGRWGELPQPPMAASVQIAGWGKPGETPHAAGPAQSGSAGSPLAHPFEGTAPPTSGLTDSGTPLPYGSAPQQPPSQGTGAPSDGRQVSSGSPRSEPTEQWNQEGAQQFTPPPPNIQSTSGTQPLVQPSGPGNPTGSGNQPAAGNPLGNPPGNPPGNQPGAGQGVRQATAQEIYDDLKIRDEFLSGVYANAVMIGHGPHEFSFDFITNFYPHSAVSARVFMAAGQIPRLYDSLRGTWEQLRLRMQPPPENPPPGWVV